MHGLFWLEETPIIFSIYLLDAGRRTIVEIRFKEGLGERSLVIQQERFTPPLTGVKFSQHPSPFISYLQYLHSSVLHCIDLLPSPAEHVHDYSKGGEGNACSRYRSGLFPIPRYLISSQPYRLIITNVLDRLRISVI